MQAGLAEMHAHDGDRRVGLSRMREGGALSMAGRHRRSLFRPSLECRNPLVCTGRC